MDIKKLLIQIILQAVDREDIEEELIKTEDLSIVGMNSITYIKAIVEIENRFQFEFDDNAMLMDTFDTLNELTAYVQQNSYLCQTIENS